DADIAVLEDKIEELIAPFAELVARCDEIPGIGRIAAAAVLAEIGLDMTRFPTPGHLASWAKYAPGVRESAGKKKGNAATARGTRSGPAAPGEAAAGAGRTRPFPGERYRRIARRRGKARAYVAVGRSILVIFWHLLSDPDSTYHELGPDFYDQHISRNRK